MEILEITVDSESEGMRIDRYLKRKFKGEPLSRIFQALRKGDVKVNGKKVKENYRLELDDKVIFRHLKQEVSLEKHKREKIYINAEMLKKYKKMVIFENEDFFIVNKSGNVPMHKGSKHSFGLSEAFKEIYKSENINFANRLDYETSGLVIGCKNLKFLRYISEKIRNNEVLKKYVAAVHGKVTENEFTLEDYLITTETGVRISKAGKEKGAKKSIAHFSLVERKKTFFKKEKISENTSVLNINLITGRKHQIRVQLSNAGYPILGDRKYGIGDNIEKLYLSCYFLSFDNFKFEIGNSDLD